jgi:hypothetical protein
MNTPMTKSRLASMLVIWMLVTASFSHAEVAYTTRGVSAQEITAVESSPGAMLADLVFLRPLGIAGMALGVAVFIVSLPFTLPTKSVNKAAQKLVVDPATYTFARPLGQM